MAVTKGERREAKRNKTRYGPRVGREARGMGASRILINAMLNKSRRKTA